MLIELIATTLDDAIAIEQAGGGRIELITGFMEGGLTPGVGLITKVCDTVHIPVNVMLRPHSNGFQYSANDIAVMKYDISAILGTKAYGIVTGMLDSSGHIHTGQLEQLLACVKDLPVTFHRAIDDSADPVASVKVLAAYPEVKTVLTSGGKGSFTERMSTILKMKEAAPRLEILVGSGISLKNIAEVHRLTATGAYHAGTAVRFDNSPVLGIDPVKAWEFVTFTKTL